MKKFLTFGGYLLAVAIVFYALDYCLGAIFDHFLFLKKDLKLERVYGDFREDIVIIGSSRAAHHYVPSVLEDSLGLSCYNYGIDGRNIFNHYVLSKQLINREHKPLVAILEVASIDIDDDPGYNEERFSHLHFLYKADNNVKEIVEVTNKKKAIVLSILNSYRYNSALLDYLKPLFRKRNDSLKGYVPLHKEWKMDAERVDGHQSVVHHAKEVYFRKLIKSFKQKGIKLLVYDSPNFKVFTKQNEWESIIEDICNEYEVPFINHEHDALFMQHREWFNEPYHLNDKGAHFYSEMVAHEIMAYLYNNGKSVQFK